LEPNDSGGATHAGSVHSWRRCRDPQGVARCDLGIKGESIVNVAECPDRPAVIHGVQHVFHPPAWLDGWPSEDRRSRLVFIGRSIPQAWIEALLEALETEVGEVTGRSSNEPRTSGPMRWRQV